MSRRILHHGTDPYAEGTLISPRAVSGCWFEWQRLGGCGAGELRLLDDFADRGRIEPDDWISFERAEGDRWYLGRVESKEATFPAGIRLRLTGMGVELGEVFPGGFAGDLEGELPQRFGASDRFTFDPDREVETFDAVSDASELVRLLLSRYVEPRTHIAFVPARVEEAVHASPVDSLKVRGEESILAIIKELAVRSRASWGVDASGEFFFLQRRELPSLVLQLGRDVTELEETSDRDLIFNRVLLTGDYVYDRRDYSGELARRSFRWRANYVQPESRDAHGERRIRMWVPWIRTQVDSLAFVREFFRTYSRPTRRYEVVTSEMTAAVFPWLGAIRIESASGEELVTGAADVIRVVFDRVPRFHLEIGPEDPRTLWPEPPQDERWELPDQPPAAGGEVSLTESPGASSPGGATSATSELTDHSTGTGGWTTSEHSDHSGSSFGSADSAESDDSTSGMESTLTETGTTSDDSVTSSSGDSTERSSSHTGFSFSGESDFSCGLDSTSEPLSTAGGGTESDEAASTHGGPHGGGNGTDEPSSANQSGEINSDDLSASAEPPESQPSEESVDDSMAGGGTGSGGPGPGGMSPSDEGDGDAASTHHHPL